MQLSWWIVPCPTDTIPLSRLCHLIINTAAMKFWKPTQYWTDLGTWRKHGWSGLEANCAFCDEVPNVSASTQLASLNWNLGTLGVLELSVRGLQRGSGTKSSCCPWNVHMICILRKPNADEYIAPCCYACLRYLIILRLLLGNEVSVLNLRSMDYLGSNCARTTCILWDNVFEKQRWPSQLRSAQLQCEL